VVRADRRAGRGVAGEYEDRREAGPGAEGLFIYTQSAARLHRLLDRYLGTVGGSVAHAGARAAGSEKGSAPGGVPGERGRSKPSRRAAGGSSPAFLQSGR